MACRFLLSVTVYSLLSRLHLSVVRMNFYSNAERKSLSVRPLPEDPFHLLLLRSMSLDALPVPLVFRSLPLSMSDQLYHLYMLLRLLLQYKDIPSFRQNFVHPFSKNHLQVYTHFLMLVLLHRFRILFRHRPQHPCLP